MCCTGTAWMANCAPAIASAADVVAFTLIGSSKSCKGRVPAHRFLQIANQPSSNAHPAQTIQGCHRLQHFELRHASMASRESLGGISNTLL